MFFMAQIDGLRDGYLSCKAVGGVEAGDFLQNRLVYDKMIVRGELGRGQSDEGVDLDFAGQLLDLVFSDNQKSLILFAIALI